MEIAENPLDWGHQKAERISQTMEIAEILDWGHWKAERNVTDNENSGKFTVKCSMIKQQKSSAVVVAAAESHGLMVWLRLCWTPGQAKATKEPSAWPGQARPI
jgi:hypothetical protein